MADKVYERNNEVVVAIEQWQDGKLLDRREAVHYFSLPNAEANQINILLSEGVDAGIIPEIEALRDAKAALLGESELIAVMDPLLQARRAERALEYGRKKIKEVKVPAGGK